jgi:hypothetical protein
MKRKVLLMLALVATTSSCALPNPDGRPCVVSDVKPGWDYRSDGFWYDSFEADAKRVGYSEYEDTTVCVIPELSTPVKLNPKGA